MKPINKLIQNFSTTNIRLLLVIALLPAVSNAQTGSVQIYCIPDVTIYVDDQIKGKTTADMSGLLVENLPLKEINIRAYKNGYETQTKKVFIQKDSIVEVRFEMKEEDFKLEKSTGLLFHFGAFGLFNVNSAFTKAAYSIGATPFIDFKFHPNFAFGAELMTMGGKPKTNDDLRLILCPNLRFRILFEPFQKVNFDILLASGFTWWPSNTKQAFLTPTLNENRMGWDFRSTAGINFLLRPSLLVNLNFGYWASSSTSDNIIWITHDTMLLSVGTEVKF